MIINIMDYDNNYVTLICVKEKGKLRIKIQSYTDYDKKTYTGVYNNTLNCRFPRNIRVEGAVYRVPRHCVKLLNNHYSVAPGFVQLITSQEDIQDYAIKEYYESTCVICLSETPDILIDPCGHVCMCKSCFRTTLKSCPICRTNIFRIINL